MGLGRLAPGCRPAPLLISYTLDFCLVFLVRNLWAFLPASNATYTSTVCAHSTRDLLPKYACIPPPALESSHDPTLFLSPIPMAAASSFSDIPSSPSRAVSVGCICRQRCQCSSCVHVKVLPERAACLSLSPAACC
ncbi:hypothetical protein GALMADRAFT_1245741 [Galerina marginata CBS 339.88]|uniref:Uncharacterized protein n=1 Tax=Galerina marginata (strain CBS 339.88) TaxID=685588 RepID=A0A067TB73_GALM3|nr:hypothetical protein GALMADRAFT_1245741 [Galerina marginata CBS 339.88]